MLAKAVDALPAEGGYPVRAQVGRLSRHRLSPRAGAVAIQSRDLRPLDRYFPELRAALLELLPDGAIVDGEIVVVGADGLDFDALQQRLHPAASRVAKLALATPASFVAFDLLAAGGTSLVAATQAARRAALENAARPRAAAALPDAGDARRRRRRRLAARSSRAPASTASSPSRTTHRTSPASGRC